MSVTYKELKDKFFEEVGKTDLSKLGLGFCGLKEYAELLKIMAEIPEETTENRMKSLASASCSIREFSGSQLPKISEINKEEK